LTPRGRRLGSGLALGRAIGGRASGTVGPIVRAIVRAAGAPSRAHEGSGAGPLATTCSELLRLGGRRFGRQQPPLVVDREAAIQSLVDLDSGLDGLLPTLDAGR
jgi:hypothetical protein